MPPAFDTSTTTSRQCVNATSGNSIPSISQIGDFIYFSKCPSDFLEFRNGCNDGLWFSPFIVQPPIAFFGMVARHRMAVVDPPRCVERGKIRERALRCRRKY